MWVLRFRCFCSPGVKGERKKVGGGLVVYFHIEVLNILKKVSKLRVCAYGKAGGRQKPLEII